MLINSLFISILGFSIETVVTSANNDSLISSFSVFMPFYLFFLSCFAGCDLFYAGRSSYCGFPYLILDKESASNVSPLNMIIISLYQGEGFPFFSYFAKRFFFF